MWVQLLWVLMHVFQLPANWLDVFLYNELYPLQNDTNKYIICNNYFISGIGGIRYPVTLNNDYFNLFALTLRYLFAYNYCCYNEHKLPQVCRNIIFINLASLVTLRLDN